MREILFRGKKFDKKEWAEGFYANSYDRAYIITMSLERIYTSDEIFPETLGQYTGLKDKNGKRIFEGDIVEQSWFDYVEPVDDSVGEVVYCENDCSFSVMDANKKEIVPLGRCHAYHWEVEVVGNIHDDPELLRNIAHQLRCTN